MSDKPKTIKEALELVKLNQKINEQEPGYSGRSGAILNRNVKRDSDSNTLGINIGGRVARTDNTPERNPEKQENLARSGEFLSNFIPAAGVAGASVKNLANTIRAARAGRTATPASSAASNAPAALPKPAATGASSGAGTAPAVRPAAPGGSATPPPRTVGSSSTAGPGYTPTGGVSSARTNTPSGSGITPGRIAAGLAGAGAVGGAAYVASRASGENADAKEKSPAAPAVPGTSGATMPGGTARATGFGLSGPQSSAGPVARSTTPEPKPAARPATPTARPAAPAPRPAAPAADPNATSKAMFQAAQDRESRGESGGGAAFFAADQQRTRELRSQKTNEETKMSSPMIQAFLKLHNKESYDNMFNEAKKHKKHLDPVGKEDEDIDNDGDSDKSDQYLHNRRKAIGKAIKESGDEGTAGAVKRDGKDVVSPTAPGGSGYKKEGPSDKEREALNKKIDKIVKEDMRRAPEDTMGAGNRLSRQNPVQRAAEKDAAMKAIAMKDAESNSKQSVQTTPTFASGNIPKTSAIPNIKPEAPSGTRNKLAPSLSMPNMSKVSAKMPSQYTEEVEFSEEELAHIASIMEISVPASPVADDYTGSNHGVSKRDLTDETISETKKKDPSELQKRGRKAGVKVGSYARKDAPGDEGEEAKAEPKNLVAQNPRTYNKDGKNMVDLEHPSKPGVKRTVPAKHYNDFRSSYLNAEKPAEKQKMHDSMVSRVFGN